MAPPNASPLCRGALCRVLRRRTWVGTSTPAGPTPSTRSARFVDHLRDRCGDARSTQRSRRSGFCSDRMRSRVGATRPWLPPRVVATTPCRACKQGGSFPTLPTTSGRRKPRRATESCSPWSGSIGGRRDGGAGVAAQGRGGAGHPLGRAGRGLGVALRALDRAVRGPRPPLHAVREARSVLSVSRRDLSVSRQDLSVSGSVLSVSRSVP